MLTSKSSTFCFSSAGLLTLRKFGDSFKQVTQPLHCHYNSHQLGKLPTQLHWELSIDPLFDVAGKLTAAYYTKAIDILAKAP